MTAIAHSARAQLSSIGQAWQSFWFEPQPMYTLGLIRMAFGGLALLWSLWLWPMRHGLLDPHGTTPAQPSIAQTWGVFQLWNSDLAMVIGMIVLALAAVALLVGWHSRPAAIVAFILILSFERRVPSAFNAGDVLVRIEALLLAVSPCGAALSLDQRRRTGSFWSAQTRAHWPIRLMQVQLSLIYLAAARSKLAGETWLDGTAVSYALRVEDMQRVPVPRWLVENPMIMNVATWGAIAIEVSIAILVWSPRFRPFVLTAGVVMHALIDLHIQIGIFSYATYVMYISWISPETVRNLADKLRGRRQQVPLQKARVL